MNELRLKRQKLEAKSDESPWERANTALQLAKVILELNEVALDQALLEKDPVQIRKATRIAREAFVAVREAKYEKELADLKTERDVAEGKLANPAPEGLKVHFETALKELVDQIVDLRASKDTLMRDARKTAEELFRDAIPGVLPSGVPWVFQASKRPPIRNVLEFVESEKSREIEAILLLLASEALPTTDLRDKQYCAVRGAMGVGKTTTTYRAVESVCAKLPEYLPCYVRVDYFRTILRMESFESVDERNILASALIFAFSAEKIAVYGPSLEFVADTIRAHLNNARDPAIVNSQETVDDPVTVKVIMHLDEFQSHLGLSTLILRACKCTLISSNLTICVIPIFSGVSDLIQIAEPVEASDWSGCLVQLGPLPLGELERKFAKALGINWGTYVKCENLRTIFMECGGNVSQVIYLVELICFEPKVHAGIRSGTLGDAAAFGVFQDSLARLQSVYGAHRWHALFTSSSPPPPPFVTKTVVLLKKIIFAVLSKCPVDPTEVILVFDKDGAVRGISWMICRNLGTIDLRMIPNSGGKYSVEASLMSLLVMNRVARYEPIPAYLQLENPFLDNWQILERVAMVSQLSAHSSMHIMSLETLRPGASFQSDYAVKIIRPASVVLSVLTTHLDSPEGMKTSEGGVASLDDGNVLVTADGQPGCDGLAILNGKVSHGRGEDENIPVLIFSQSKKQEISGITDEASGSTLYDGTIETVILPKMREVATEFRQMNSGMFKEAFVVYDIFSDRLGPKRGRKDFQLETKEAVIVTRSEALDSVLGGLYARKRTLDRE